MSPTGPSVVARAEISGSRSSGAASSTRRPSRPSGLEPSPRPHRYRFTTAREIAMPDDPHVRGLLDGLLDLEATPVVACGACPELLPVIRERWRQICRVRVKLDELLATRAPNGSPPLLTEVLPPPHGLGYVRRAGARPRRAQRDLPCGAKPPACWDGPPTGRGDGPASLGRPGRAQEDARGGHRPLRPAGSQGRESGCLDPTSPEGGPRN